MLICRSLTVDVDVFDFDFHQFTASRLLRIDTSLEVVVSWTVVMGREDRLALVEYFDGAFAGVMNHVQVEPMIEYVWNQALVFVVSQFAIPDMEHSSRGVCFPSEDLHNTHSIGAFRHVEVSLKLMSPGIPMWLNA